LVFSLLNYVVVVIITYIIIVVLTEISMLFIINLSLLEASLYDSIYHPNFKINSIWHLVEIASDWLEVELHASTFWRIKFDKAFAFLGEKHMITLQLRVKDKWSLRLCWLHCHIEGEFHVIDVLKTASLITWKNMYRELRNMRPNRENYNTNCYYLPIPEECIPLSRVLQPCIVYHLSTPYQAQ